MAARAHSLHPRSAIAGPLPMLPPNFAGGGGHCCVMMLPDPKPSLLPGLVRYLLHPASLRGALDGLPFEVADEYGRRGEAPWGGLGSGGGLPFDVLGLFRGVIPPGQRGMVPLPPGCGPLDPVLCVLVSHPEALPLLEVLQNTLKAVTLEILTVPPSPPRLAYGGGEAVV